MTNILEKTHPLGERDTEAAVTPIGQLPFFIQFLKVGDLFEPWVSSCPLSYTSNNVPKKVDVLGSFYYRFYQDTIATRILQA
jgi:hypothetical protein